MMIDMNDEVFEFPKGRKKEMGQWQVLNMQGDRAGQGGSVVISDMCDGVELGQRQR